MSIPLTETTPVPKKSNTLLPSMRLSRFTVLLLVVVPTAEIPLTGRLLPAGPMLFPEMVLLLLPVVVVVLKRTAAPAVPTVTIDEPRIVQFFTTLLVAPLIKRMVLVPAVADVLAFENVNEFPPEFSPSTVTTSAPLKSISGKARFPDTVRAAPPEGDMVIDVYDEGAPLAFKTAEAASVVSPRMKMLIAP
jgi:hypothetical protein